MRVFINPTYTGADRADGGIRRVVEAQQRYLPEFGIQVTASPDDADLIANHGAMLAERPGVPMVAHTHGLMWSEYRFGQWGDDINTHVIEAMARADAVTAPSQWVRQAITRGMLVDPTVIYHGIDADAWAHDEESLGYVLWNKARVDQVSSPDDMNAVAALLPEVPFLSTFGERAPNVHLLGALTYDEMRPIVQRAGVYLATARETFGIGTLEALAAGVPVAGWRYGGQEEIVVAGETGYLAPYGDYEALAECIQRCLAERARLSAACVADARARWGWRDKVAQYAALYQATLAAYTAPRPKVSVVVTTHNLARFLPDALGSVQAQTMDDWECVVVDDASEDNPKVLMPRDKRFRYLRTPENLKLSGARNYGWQHAKGRYILFLDADDMLTPNALDVLAQALDTRSDIHIAYGHLDIVGEDGTNRQRNPWPPSRFDWRAQIAHLNQLPYAAMVRRAVLDRSGGYRVRDWRAEDASFWARVTSFGFRAAKVTEDATLIYRLRSDSKSRGEDGDGDWTAWLPWRLGDGTGRGGVDAYQAKQQAQPQLVPFGAQGTPPAPLRAWPVSHQQAPAVSVVIPVGPGHARHLIDALDSLVAQSCPAWEAIVVNDSGADLGYVHPFARVLTTAGRQGAGHARNRGLDAARAPLVLFLDADDILPPRALEAMLDAFIGSGGKYVYGDWLHLEDEARWDGPAVYHSVPEYDPRLWLDGAQHAVTCLVPTEDARAVGGFDEALPAWEDWDFLIKLAVAGVCGQRVGAPTLIYRLESGQRRRLGDAREAELLQTIRDRYAAYRTGAQDMGTCCGGKAPAINGAQNAIDQMMGLLGYEVPQPAPEAVQPQVVRLEFVGDQWGATTWLSKDRQRRYTAGRDPSVRYLDVPAEDAEHLIAFGVFRRVELAPAIVEPEVEVVAAEPRAQRRGRR